MNRVAIVCLFILLLIVFSAVISFAAAEYFPVDREFHPYYPSLIKWDRSGAGFTEPEALHARLLYRQADQQVVRKLLQADPEDVNLDTIYGIIAKRDIPVVEMTRTKASFKRRGK